MILDECREFLAGHLTATDAQLDAMTLYAAATHGLDAFVTFGRVLYTSETEESGKTLAMMLTASLSARPMDTSGTVPALDSALAAASNEPEKPTPTLYRDEISDVFGRSGVNGSASPVAEILRKGYKRGPTRQRSVNRVPEEFSIFTPFLMTGLRTAVPRDIRTRCIVILMQRGTPARYFDVREGEPYAKSLQEALARTVKNHVPELQAFRGRGIHGRLANRKLEIWEPLLAVAYVLGGQAWLNRAVNAFCELSLDESDVIPLTPRQQVLKDVAEAASARLAGTPGEPALSFIGGLSLCDELKRIDNPVYAGRSEASLACLIRDAVPYPSERRRVNGELQRGYPLQLLLDAWEAVKPADAEDSEVPAEDNPFAMDDTDEEDMPDERDVPGVPCVPGSLAVIHGTCEREHEDHEGHFWGRGDRFYCDGDVGYPVDSAASGGILASGGTSDEHDDSKPDS